MGALGTTTAEALPLGRSTSGRMHPGSPARSQRSNDRCQPPVLIAADESVGRHLQVQLVPTKVSQKQKWLKACIVDFNVGTGQHKVQYMERGQRDEEWLALDRTQFGWLSDPGTQSNPTYHATLTPQKEAALDHAVAVFWPGMSKWYKGRVRSYNAATRQHVVCFHDGYVRDYDMRHEAIMWLDVPGLATREDLSHWQRLADLLPSVKGPSDDALQQGSARSTRSGPSRRTASSRKARLTDSHSASPVARRCPASTAAFRLGDSTLKQGGGRRDGLHPVIVIKGVEGAGAAEVCQPLTHPAVSRLKEGDTGSSISQGSQAEALREEESESISRAHMSPAEAQQQQVGARQGGTEQSQAKIGEACSTDVGQDERARNASRDDDASSSARCSEGTALGAFPGTDTQRPTSAGSSGMQPHSGQQWGEQMGDRTQAEQWAGMALQPGLRKIRVRPGGRCGGPGRSRGGGPGTRRRSGSTEPSSARRKLEGPCASSPLARAGESVVGTRIGIWWPADEAYYRGKVTSYDSYHKRSKVRYDDDEEEWLALPRQRFISLLPRARSAGCTPTFVAAMIALGAHNVTAQGTVPNTGCAEDISHMVEGHSQAGRQEDVVSWRISLLCPGTGEVSHGEILGWDADTDHHLVLYDDGEHERVVLSQERVDLHPPQRGVAAQMAPGLPEGEPVPKGKAAIGWRIGVYWKDDQKFYQGEVESFETATGRHVVLYDDGEREPISLSKEKVKWVLPPGVHASEEAASESEAEQEERDECRVLHRHLSRGRLRKRNSPCLEEGGRSHKLAKFEVVEGVPAWRFAPGPQASTLPAIVRDLGTSHELRSRHGHRLAIRTLRIFLPQMHGPFVQPCGLPTIKTESASPLTESKLQELPGREQCMDMADHDHLSCPRASENKDVEMQIMAPVSADRPERLNLCPSGAVSVSTTAPTPLVDTVHCTSPPYSMIPPTDWLAPVPALSQPPPPASEVPTGSTAADWSPTTAIRADMPLSYTAVHSDSRSASGSPSCMSGFLGLFRISSRRLPPSDPSCLPPLVSPACDPEMQLVHCDDSTQLDCEGSKLFRLASEIGSGGSLPVPDTPAAMEELKGRLMHHSSSLTNSDIQRPSSAGSQGGLTPGLLASAARQDTLSISKQSSATPVSVEAGRCSDTHELASKFCTSHSVPGLDMGVSAQLPSSARVQSLTVRDTPQLQQQHSIVLLEGHVRNVEPAKSPFQSRCSQCNKSALPCCSQAVKAAAL